MPPGFHHPGSLAAVPPPYSFPSLPVSSVYPGQAIANGPSSEDAIARKKTAEASAGADLAPRPRRHRSLVTKRGPAGLPPAARRPSWPSQGGQRADLEEATEASLADATGEVGFDEEFADTGSFTFERERDLSLVGNAKDLIDKVEHALARMDSGRFGRREACGGTIEAERLDALPYATLCLADARQQARRR